MVDYSTVPVGTAGTTNFCVILLLFNRYHIGITVQACIPDYLGPRGPTPFITYIKRSWRPRAPGYFHP